MFVIDEIKEAILKNNDKRICVVGTTCIGKTTLLKSFPFCCDMDELLFPLLTDKEEEIVCGSPWTEEIGQYMDSLAKERIKIEVGHPVFSTVLLDSDLYIVLVAQEKVLKERTKLRGTDYESSLNMQNKIIKEIEKTNIPHIKIEVK